VLPVAPTPTANPTQPPTQSPSPTPRPTQTPVPTPPPTLGHDSRTWHPPTDHEHGDAPPQWIMAAGYTVGFDQHGGFHGNTSATENTTKHAAMKGFAARFKGVDVYFRVHIASNVLDRMARYHSYEVWARDASGGVSHWQGWFNSGDPVADRVPRTQPDPGRRPVVLVVDAASLANQIGCEQWYGATASWSWDFGWTVCGTTTVFYPGENDQPGTEHWRTTGANGAELRRLEAAWYDGSYGRFHPVGRFWATQFGEGVIGPNDPRCSMSTTKYGVSYQNLCLEQYIAPTMTEVAFPDNAVQKPFGVPGLRLPN
jgi:hypothetical protein